jgi:hypothetical protein
VLASCASAGGLTSPVAQTNTSSQDHRGIAALAGVLEGFGNAVIATPL